MKENRAGKAIMVATAILALIASTCLAMSIETEPVKVTHRNSGPRYDITADNEVERTKLAPDEPMSPQAGQPQPPAMREQPEGEQTGGPMPIGHVAIRRIYLFPVMSRSSSEDEAESERPAPPHAEHEQPMPSMFAKPFWPFLTPNRPSPGHRHHDGAARPHLFGADDASRSHSSQDQDKAASGEREGQHSPMRRPEQPLFDPIQMMLNMMHQAINAQMVPPSDLSKDDKSPSNDNAPSESSSDERPKMPAFSPRPTQNETNEEIVEIDGKKYLRKTIVNRHVGENIIFMTKRLIFVPLNETDSTTTETVATTASTSTSAPTTTTTEDSSVIPDRVGENKPVTTTTGEPATTESPTTASSTNSQDAVTMTSTASPAAEQPSTTSATTEPAAEATTTTTPRATESFVDRVSDVIEKAAERLVDEVKPSSTSTTAAPAQ